jgi:hypothetical protein
LSIDAFEDYLDQFGSDVSAWPEPIGRAARNLLAISPTAAAAWQDAKLVDDMLATRSSGPTAPDLVSKIKARQQTLAPAAVAAPWFAAGGKALSGLRAGLLCGAFVLIGLVAGKAMSPDAARYDVSSVFVFCSDMFYL